MPAARGVKRTASKSTTSTASAAPTNKKKRNVIQLEVPTLPKRRGRVLACGQGDVGQLGLGEDVIETTKFKHVTGLGDNIVYVCAGGMHTIALDSDGKVWTFGCNDEGALGRTTTGEADEGTPKQVSLPLPAVTISAGDSHSAALLNNGHVYAWGSFRDSHGSMGLVVRGREGKACRSPVRVAVSEPAHSIASGGDHLVILTTSGAVYTLGCGEQGQLGRLAQRSASRDTRQGFTALLSPGKVTLRGGAERVWAGYHATFALSPQRRLLAWGLNNYNQLGITGEKRRTALFSPVECDAFSCCNANWKQVACGQHHSLALDENGQVYAIGRCEYGRLGLGDRAGDAEAPEPIPKLQNKKCVSIAAGTSNSFAVTDTGEVFAWGMGSEGQLGTGASADAPEPTPAVLPPAATATVTAAHIAAGGQHTVLLAVDPNARSEPAPAPETETQEEKVEEQKDEKVDGEPEEKKPRTARGGGARRGRRGAQPEQEDDVSSTSSAAPAAANTQDDTPQKVNGDEKLETPMEVDETDSKQDTNKKEDETEQKETQETEDTKPETTDTSSQDTVESDTKPDTDVEMEAQKSEQTVENSKPETPEATDNKVELNGAPEEATEKAKTVESLTEEMNTA